VYDQHVCGLSAHRLRVDGKTFKLPLIYDHIYNSQRLIFTGPRKVTLTCTGFDHITEVSALSSVMSFV